jgi:succinate-semialdehyde dehydrogenase/glutarate-semialdehyde dehydrogenase
MKQARLFIDGQWTYGDATSPIIDKFDQKELGTVHEAAPDQVTHALERLRKAIAAASFPHYDRYLVLSRASALLAQRAAEFVEAVIDDTGFTVADATREVTRATQTLLLCGEEAKRIHGEVVPLHGAPGAGDRLAFTVRHPLGVVCAITPFNSPLNTVAHKVGPALAAGNAVILKPAKLTPLSAVKLVELLLECGLPEGLIALVHGNGPSVGETLLTSPVPSFYAFTGSTGVGAHIRRTIGLRKAQLELGSLSSTIICNDAPLERAVEACINAAFRKAGQVCTSIQRLYVQSGVTAEFADELTKRLNRRSVGDPRRDDTFVGPLISAAEADRVEKWVNSAIEHGARAVTGAEREGQVISPTVLTDVDAGTDVMAKEVFGPVVNIVPFDDLAEAISAANDTPYGLAAGLFTSDLNTALTAAGQLRMGSVHINETSSSRVDLMPYGGVKDSGTGLEGPRYAIEEMTEQRLISLGPA